MLPRWRSSPTRSARYSLTWEYRQPGRVSRNPRLLSESIPLQYVLLRPMAPFTVSVNVSWFRNLARPSETDRFPAIDLPPILSVADFPARAAEFGGMPLQSSSYPRPLNAVATASPGRSAASPPTSRLRLHHLGDPNFVRARPHLCKTPKNAPSSENPGVPARSSAAPTTGRAEKASIHGLTACAVRARPPQRPAPGRARTCRARTSPTCSDLGGASASAPDLMTYEYTIFAIPLPRVPWRSAKDCR